MSLFRNIAQFIVHKRDSCYQRLRDVRHVYRRDPDQFDNDENLPSDEQEETVFVEPEPVETVFSGSDLDLSSYSPTLALLRESGALADMIPPAAASLKPPAKPKRNLDAVVSQLNSNLHDRRKALHRKESHHSVRLEPMVQTTKAVFQVRICYFLEFKFVSLRILLFALSRMFCHTMKIKRRPVKLMRLYSVSSRSALFSLVQMAAQSIQGPRRPT